MKIAVPSRTHKEVATQTLRSIAGSKPAAHFHTHGKRLGSIGAVFFLTTALVGIVIRSTPEVSVVTEDPTQIEVIPATEAEADVTSEPITEAETDATIATAPLIGDFGFSLGSPDQSIETPP